MEIVILFVIVALAGAYLGRRFGAAMAKRQPKEPQVNLGHRLERGLRKAEAKHRNEKKD